MGVWIEIPEAIESILSAMVAPFVGVWIEISYIEATWNKFIQSLPSWECGLKFI